MRRSSAAGRNELGVREKMLPCPKENPAASLAPQNTEAAILALL